MKNEKLRNALSLLSDAENLNELCDMLNDIEDEFPDYSEYWDDNGFNGGAYLPIFAQDISFDDIHNDTAFSWDWDGYIVRDSKWTIIQYSEDSRAYYISKFHDIIEIGSIDIDIDCNSSSSMFGEDWEEIKNDESGLRKKYEKYLERHCEIFFSEWFYEKTNINISVNCTAWLNIDNTDRIELVLDSTNEYSRTDEQFEIINDQFLRKYEFEIIDSALSSYCDK